MKILVTGSAGMIGSCLVKKLLDQGYEVVGLDRREGCDSRAENVVADLADGAAIRAIVENRHVDRVIHLAALAHTANEDDLSYEKYYHVNVKCAENVFQAAGDRPLLFVSTVDVFGFAKGMVSAGTPLKPVTNYGKTKALAETCCRKICSRFTIFRFSPVYTPEIKRDIQKRYYLKYPNLAYQIGRGSEYEVLNIEKAVGAMADWCAAAPDNQVHIIKDEQMLDTVACIREEKSAGRAKYVLHFPRFLVRAGFAVLKALTGENQYTYLLSKAVNPLRTE